MRTSLIVGMVAVVFLGAGAALAYCIVSGVFEPEAPPSPDYSGVSGDDEIITLEFARFKELHASGQSHSLHPKAKAIVDAMPSFPTEHEFRNRVAADLAAIFREQAQGFRNRHPDLWALHTKLPPQNTRVLNTDSDAVMPYCLDPHDMLPKIVNYGLIVHLMSRFEKVLDIEFRVLEEEDLRGLEVEVVEFLQVTKQIDDALEATLKKQRIYAYTTKPYDPKWEVPLPIPRYWAEVLFKRIQIQLIRGEFTGAKSTTLRILELSERAELSHGFIGALFQLVVLQTRFIDHCVTPGAMHGAFSADELDEICRRGKAVGFDVGRAAANEVAPMLLQFLSPGWYSTRNAGNKGIPRMMADLFGKVGVDVWLALADTERPKRIALFESALHSMMAGEYQLVTEDDFHRCQELMNTVIDPLVSANGTVNVRDMYVSQLGWIEVQIRAEEIRRQQPLSKWNDPLSPFSVLNGLKAVRASDRIDLFYDHNYFAQFGVRVPETELADSVAFVTYRNWN